ncbi:MAG: hypothetical protein KDA96_11345 [Planctomycetaceae bacterium]|nr:hypothetical protein [Planctomycetaceae bacterium]
MKVDFEFEPLALARSAAEFCHNPREAVSEWGTIKTRIQDELRFLRAGSHSTFELNLARVRLVCFTERFQHASTKLPVLFDKDTLRVFFKLQNLTLAWVRREMRQVDRKGDRFVDMPGEQWMRAWNEFCDAYESFSRKVEFEVNWEELKGLRNGNRGKGAASSAKFKASGAAAAAVESSRNKPGTGAELLQAHLRQHHKYKGGNPPMVGNLKRVACSKALAEELEIAVGTVSLFFQKWFGGRKQYDRYCEEENHGAIAFALQLMSGEVAPRELRRSLEEEARSMTEANG